MRIYDWSRTHRPVDPETLVNVHVYSRTIFGRAKNIALSEWANADWYSVVRHGDD